MLKLKKIWVFLKTHWYIPVLLIVGIILKSKSDSLLKIIDAQKETYEKEKEAILDAEIEKKKMTEKVDKEYQETVEKFKVLHQIQRKELTKEKEKEIKKIIKKNYNKPEKMTKELSDMFGIIHVPKINNDNN
jgi:Na+-transporting NADH:ubiquinone oxidoreductase subunit NqrC